MNQMHSCHELCGAKIRRPQSRALVGNETVEDLWGVCRSFYEQLERERAENQRLGLALLFYVGSDNGWLPN